MKTDYMLSVIKTSGRIQVSVEGVVLQEYKDTRGNYTGRWRPVGRLAGSGRPQIMYNGVAVYCARLVWFWFNGEIPDGMEVDHKNDVKTDNRIENLQLLSRLANQQKAERKGIRRGPSPKRGEGVQAYWDALTPEQRVERRAKNACKMTEEQKKARGKKIWETRRKRGV